MSHFQSFKFIHSVCIIYKINSLIQEYELFEVHRHTLTIPWYSIFLSTQFELTTNNCILFWFGSARRLEVVVL